ncbi:MAG: hypothetical protein AB8B82_16340 [Roseovarius sp.]
MLRAKHGARGKTLEARVAHAGRRLPKRIRTEAQMISDAERLPAHPKLGATVDHARLARAFDTVQNHLNGVDPADRRKGKLLGWLGGQAFNLLVIAGVLITVLTWRGFVG